MQSAFWLVLGVCMALAAQAWSVTQTTPLTLGVVVTTCGTPPWTYVAGTQQPITIGASTGAICVSQ